MRTIVLATALVLSTLATSPVASAGEEHPIVDAIYGHIDNLADNATAILDGVGDQPGVFVVDQLYNRTCGANANNPDCRLLSGRPITGGAFAMCEPSGNSTLRMAFGAANATVELATKAAFRGTALEGEDLCEEHWSTLRALATLP